MAHNSQLPCDRDGICMKCKEKPTGEEETLTCKTCITPWHVNCLTSPPQTLTSTLQWECPDCDAENHNLPLSSPAAPPVESGNLIAAIREIESNQLLTDQEKAKKRQELLSRGGKSGSDLDGDGDDKNNKKKDGDNDVLDLFDDFNCSFCMQLPERPVTVSPLDLIDLVLI